MGHESSPAPFEAISKGHLGFSFARLAKANAQDVKVGWNAVKSQEC
jgi:hypothetical protein